MNKLTIHVALLAAIVVLCCSVSQKRCDPNEACTDIYQPVCGSDGKTYPSSCVLEAQTCGTGVTVAYPGECVGTTTTDPCAGPKACPLIFKQVCGSDGVTYDNSCELQANTCGKDVTWTDGACATTTTPTALP